MRGEARETRAALSRRVVEREVNGTLSGIFGDSYGLRGKPAIPFGSPAFPPCRSAECRAGRGKPDTAVRLNQSGAERQGALMSRRIFRYVPHTVELDPFTHTEFSVTCVSGDDIECGAESAMAIDPSAAAEWMRKHAQATGHKRYRRNFGDYVTLEPPEKFDGRLIKGNMVTRPASHDTTDPSGPAGGGVTT
ncbi:DUF7848 domain-containing protein [Streptomyces varsoviensis]|uniref:DUF7848 domain-containing protein n=1 Tax=Streptomyces varsoviensis TaxID=67373 RepID=UPI0007C50F07|nr:hypothetical protein [Streptomyces varsoviensis]